MSVILILICIFNVVMWIVFLRHFKNLFTTEDIISGTKDEVNKILMDLDRQTERNLMLMDNSISKMKSLNAEIDKKLKLLDDLKNSAAGAAGLTARINSKPSAGRKIAASAYEKSRSPKKTISSEDTVVLTRNGEQLSVEPFYAVNVVPGASQQLFHFFFLDELLAFEVFIQCVPRFLQIIQFHILFLLFHLF